MLTILTLTGSSIISQSIYAADKDEFGGDESDGDKTNLSNLSISKKSTKAAYLTFRYTQKGGAILKKMSKLREAPIT